MQTYTAVRLPFHMSRHTVTLLMQPSGADMRKCSTAKLNKVVRRQLKPGAVAQVWGGNIGLRVHPVAKSMYMSVLWAFE